jgi:hypothetical protein
MESSTLPYRKLPPYKTRARPALNGPPELKVIPAAFSVGVVTRVSNYIT